MKTRRVGTISMAIVLIAFGILIFIAQINKLSAVELAIKFWPSILILLGGEILWFSFKEKKENENIAIRYDVFSIFIVMVILFVNIFIYGLVETGTMNWIKSRIASQTFNYELPLEEYDVDDNIEKIIIDSPRYPGFTVRTIKGNKVTTSGFINITADSEENAKRLLNENHISVNKSGNIMYVTFKEQIGYYHNFRDLNIAIPDNKEIEINGGNDLDLIIDSLNNNLIVDNIDGLKVRVNKNLNIKVETITNNEDDLKGNIEWNTVQIGSEDSPKYKGELVYGDGNNTLKILNCYGIVVDGI